MKRDTFSALIAVGMLLLGTVELFTPNMAVQGTVWIVGAMLYSRINTL